MLTNPIPQAIQSFIINHIEQKLKNQIAIVIGSSRGTGAGVAKSSAQQAQQ